MKLSDFRSYQLAVQFYRLCSDVRAPLHLRTQLLRAASSVVLNLAEGSARASFRERVRFYDIAMASVRECQAVLDLVPVCSPEVRGAADGLSGSVYRLVQGAGRLAPAACPRGMPALPSQRR
jgi:four helix bundle protein